MKFTLNFKTPDVFDGMREEFFAEAKRQNSNETDEEELEAIAGQLEEKARDFADKWLRWSEYVGIEFDTEKGTATVLPVRK